MEYRSSEVKAGFFIFVSLLALIVMIFVLGNLQDIFKPKRELRIIFNFTGGLEVGAPVRYAGLEVGRVDSIDLLDPEKEKDTDRVVVVTQISPSITVKKNSSAMIKTSGLMGGLYIDIRPGTRKSPVLGEKEPLVGRDSFEFAKIGDMVREVVTQVQRFTQLTEDLTQDSRDTLKAIQVSLQNVNNIIMDNRESVQGNLKNFLVISKQIARILDEKGSKIRDTLDHLNSVVTKTDDLLSSKKTLLAEIIDQTHKVTRELEILMADTRPGLTNLIRTMESDTHQVTMKIDSAAASLDETFQQSNAILLENRRNLLELTRNLKETTQNLKEFTSDLKRNPWKLIRKTDEKPVLVEGKPAEPNEPLGLRMKRLDKLPAK